MSFTEVLPHTGGTIARVAILGSADTGRYMKRWPLDRRKGGGYQIQSSPHDLAALVGHAKPWLRGKRMLVLGGDTMGAERFIAEYLGVLSVEVISESFSIHVNYINPNLESMREAGVSVKHVLKAEGLYDLITLFGDFEFNVDSILQHLPIGGLIACLGTNANADQPGLRRAWLYLRRKHHPILQTVDSHDVGCGLIKINHQEEWNAVQVEKAKGLPLFTRAGSGEGVPSGNPAGSQASAVREPSGEEEAEEEIGGTPQGASVQEGEPEDRQAEGVRIYRGSLDGKVIVDMETGRRILDVEAPYGRKKNGEPKKRPGRTAA